MKPIGRKVNSGSYPLYRLTMLATLVSGILQLVTNNVPDSIDNHPGTVSNVAYVVAQLVGSLLILSSFWVSRAWYSLQLERLGCICIGTNVTIYTIVIVAKVGLPLSAATWTSIAVGLYCVYRSAIEIPRELTDLREIARERAPCAD